ncbi:MAG: DUF2155 domain-containing protein [Rickettsiales bacterium]|jgi:hypothetical protein|nr:DUF2155 domain-containing protein [Rickettsiales bacterium]
MKKIMKLFMISIFCAAVFCGAHADEYINKDTAVVRVMNKSAGKAQTATLPVGQTTQIENLSVLVRTCKQTAAYTAENFFMFVEIEKRGNKIFSGWMNRNEPGDNPLQDADYDLWLIKCE